MLYRPPEPRQWPPRLPRPSTDQIAEAVAVSMGLGSKGAFMGGNNKRRVPECVIARHMFGLLASRIRGMSTPEVADVIGVAAHSTFTNNGRWVPEFCRSSSGTAAYNEIVKALEMGVIHEQSLEYSDAARRALSGRAGRAVVDNDADKKNNQQPD